MLKLKLQYFGHLMWRIDSLEKTLILGKLKAGGEADNRGWDGWMASPTPGTWVWASSRSWWWIGKPGVLQSMGSQRVGHDWATELNWTELIIQVELGLKWTKLQATQFKKLSKLCRKLYLWYIFYHIILLYDFVTLLYSILSINFYVVIHITSVQFSSVAQSCLTLFAPMDCGTPGLPVHHQLLEFIQTHVHRVGDVIQSSHPLSFPSPPAPNPSQHQSLFQWVNSLHEVAKVLEFQLYHQSFQRTSRTDLL